MRPGEGGCRSAAVLLCSSSGRKQHNHSHRLLLITTEETERQADIKTDIKTEDGGLCCGLSEQQDGRLMF